MNSCILWPDYYYYLLLEFMLEPLLVLLAQFGTELGLLGFGLREPESWVGGGRGEKAASVPIPVCLKIEVA